MHDEEDDDQLYWNLGFVEPITDKRALLRHRFPSKIGGRPAWLDPVHIPTATLLCPTTQHTMQFLLQLYAPLDGVAHAFHRTVYMFISPQGGRLHTPGHVVALRSQLPLHNALYPSTPAAADDVYPRHVLSESDMQLALQRDPWQVVLHEQPGVEGHPIASPTKVLSTLFPEYKLLVQDEYGDDDDDESGWEEDGDGMAMEAVAMRSQDDDDDDGQQEDNDITAEAIDSVEAQLRPEQKHFATFATRIAAAPDQVVRYCFEDGAQPLTPNIEPAPPLEVPPCGACGGPRRFEFQVGLLLFKKRDDPGLLGRRCFVCVETCVEMCARVRTLLQHAHMYTLLYVYIYTTCVCIHCIHIVHITYYTHIPPPFPHTHPLPNRYSHSSLTFLMWMPQTPMHLTMAPLPCTVVHRAAYHLQVLIVHMWRSMCGYNHLINPSKGCRDVCVYMHSEGVCLFVCVCVFCVILYTDDVLCLLAGAC